MATSKNEEEAQIEHLMDMMGDLDPGVARRVLRKCGGDIQKAATAILEGNLGGPSADSWSGPQTEQLPARPNTPSVPQIRVSRQGSQSAVIDLTEGDEDDEISRALKASLEPVQNEAKFGPSDRVPHPDWAVVPSNAQSDTAMSQDDQTLSRAIEESLSSTYNDQTAELYEPWSDDKLLRKGGRPVAVRPSAGSLFHASLLLQSLYFVPQVRQRLARWRMPAIPGVTEIDIREEFPAKNMLCLQELFTTMDLTVLSELMADPALDRFRAESWISAIELPGDHTTRFLTSLIQYVESQLNIDGGDSGNLTSVPRLFSFRHGYVNASPLVSKLINDTSCFVRIETGGPTPTPNDLVSRLSSDVLRNPSTTDQQAIFEPSEVVAFQLKQHHGFTSGSSSSSSGSTANKPFTYPKSIYMDQFLTENLEIVQKERERQKLIDSQIQKLAARTKVITNLNDKDTLKDLRASIYYYENVAEAKGDKSRQAAIQRTATKLRNILTVLEEELKGLKSKTEALEMAAKTLFESPELKKHRYDLRVVLMHDGLYGRKHLYSYVCDNGSWWKCSDSDISEASEENALSDQVGIHLGGGPFLLFYSRALPDGQLVDTKDLWPTPFKNNVNLENATIIGDRPENVQKKAQAQNEPS